MVSQRCSSPDNNPRLMSWSEACVRHPGTGFSTGTRSPLIWGENQRACWGAVRHGATALEEPVQRPADSPSRQGHSRLNTAWGSSRLAGLAQGDPPDSPRLLLPPSVFWCCSPLRRRPPLPVSVHTVGESGAGLGAALPLRRRPAVTAS